MNVGDFCKSINGLVERYKGRYERSLGEYLRSLWTAVGEHRQERPSFHLFALLLEEAFQCEPVEFDDLWLRFIDPRSAGERYKRKEISAFDYLTEVVLFQIADLKRMTGNELENEYRYFGVTSPTGNDWYNFDPLLYLECAAAGFFAHSNNPNRTKCEWSDLAEFLELGRIYE